MNRHYISICAYATLLCLGLCITVIGPAMGEIAVTFGVGTGSMGLLTVAFSAGFIAAVFLSGFVADRISLKPLVCFGQAAIAAGLGAFAFCQTIETGMASYLLVGLGGGLVQISANTLISSLHHETRASSLNLLHFFYGTGALSGPILSGLALARGFYWYTIYSVLAVMAFLVLLILLPARFPARQEPSASPVAAFLSIMKNGYVMLIALAAVLYVGIEMGINSWSVLYLETSLGMEKVAASAVLSYFWFFMTFGRIICVYCARVMRADTLLLALCAGSGVACAGFVVSHNAVMAGVALSMTGLFFSGVFPLLIGLGGNAYPGQVGAITSVMLTSLGIGLMVFPWAAGAISERWSLSAGMVFICAASGALLITAWAISRRGRSG
jgi:fucose permease